MVIVRRRFLGDRMQQFPGGSCFLRKQFVRVSVLFARSARTISFTRSCHPRGGRLFSVPVLDGASERRSCRVQALAQPAIEGGVADSNQCRRHNGLLCERHSRSSRMNSHSVADSLPAHSATIISSGGGLTLQEDRLRDARGSCVLHSLASCHLYHRDRGF